MVAAQEAFPFFEPCEHAGRDDFAQLCCEECGRTFCAWCEGGADDHALQVCDPCWAEEEEEAA